VRRGGITIERYVKPAGQVVYRVYYDDVKVGQFHKRKSAYEFIQGELKPYLYQAQLEAAREVAL
jgi:hypothetical protein